MAEGSGFGRGGLGWLSGHARIILRYTPGHNGQERGHLGIGSLFDASRADSALAFRLGFGSLWRFRRSVL